MLSLRKGKIILSLALALILVSSVFAGGCGEEEVALDEISLAKVEWTCSTQKSYVNKEILESLGFDVELENYTLPVVLQGMSDGDIDVFTDAWFQTWGTPLENALEAGDVIHLETHLEETAYAPAVPTYVYEEGITSLEDLADYSEEFDYTYYGLEEGNDGNQIMIDAFEDDTYGLGEWELIPSNEAAMMAEVEQAIDNEEWVVFSGWEPHYMNVLFDMEYLDDPEGIWGEGEKVGTISRPGFEEENPNLAKYFIQFDVDEDIVNDWVYEHGYYERPAEEVAQEWVEENLDLVLEWVDGMETPDGEDAQEVLKEVYEG
ncbi:glycine betaine ABC transporter substrate-binding protein [Natranaerofaba carboxydovora]|uniref:glycine betaine ABC transporter substrate-binding protein n=1 Tax=Natranaerofaba carboxydovora TaxID=2742683 RepID=UPI001F1453F4|nr:glycine betaine ABC transporter substrate-binding protein [Natranaerofaba carboxydovora]UMZ74557.1 Glycine betaine-binding protein OpuAC [Natranaerofaba carboxydovora]